ncbi:hypothetical protein [Streptomyces sp. HD]|nr:hypothetical protein [Streptomyces sp. HD]MDC0773332.1 hypothetical protein [Streptomyces sp. HD]
MPERNETERNRPGRRTASLADVTERVQLERYGVAVLEAAP